MITHKSILEFWNLGYVGHREDAHETRRATTLKRKRYLHKQKRTNQENEAKTLPKFCKIALEIELDGVLGALLIQTSIKDAFPVNFLQNFGCPKGSIWDSKRAFRALFTIT